LVCFVIQLIFHLKTNIEYLAPLDIASAQKDTYLELKEGKATQWHDCGKKVSMVD